MMKRIWRGSVMVLSVLICAFACGRTKREEVIVVGRLVVSPEQRYMMSQQEQQHEDPFAVFDDEEEDPAVAPRGDDAGAARANDDQADVVEQAMMTPALRDREGGFLQFHPGTEQALLVYVQNALAQQCQGSSAERDSSNRADQVLQLVDKFCFSRHWMMHIGPEKGAVLKKFLSEHWMQTQQQQKNGPIVVVELGTYCGYSASLMAETLRELAKSEADSNYKRDFVIFTVDVDPERQQVARELVKLAGVAEYIRFVQLHPSDNLAATLKQQIVEACPDHSAKIDFLFVDHVKDLYLPDVVMLEEAGLIRAGTAVAADNVVFFGLDGYRDHMQQLAQQSVVTTRLVRGRIEYMDERTRHEYKQGGGGGDPPDGMGTSRHRPIVTVGSWFLMPLSPFNIVIVQSSQFT